MALTGQAKKDYQREYMRRRRSNQGSNAGRDSVRPKVLDPVIPEQSKGQIKLHPRMQATEVEYLVRMGLLKEPEPQSHSPMMVGYVPPEQT